ncbi:MepB family protein [Reichenbachiella sp. MALMAid0571]|uniref:MepB family protein n=1 Tax=Reichenbachiella sp. MALMAid0571 TaxID=3143939 RepID=UPI0032DFA4F8
MKTNQVSESREKTFLLVREQIYDKSGFELTNLQIEKESREYDASTFEIGRLKVIFRSAKITPTKTGQFVTLWKRIADGPIQPYDVADDFDLVIVVVKKDDYLGQFVFPKSVLTKHHIISNNQKEGKRAIRVYPPWDIASNKQAQSTQKWQLEYFLSADMAKSIDLGRARKLYFQNYSE